MGKPLILLDRDGVLNRMVVNLEHGTIDSPLHPRQVELIVGVPEALARLTAAGYTLAVVTNQPAAAKHKTTRANLEAVHETVLLAGCSLGGRIASSHICYHRADDGCSCRKPKPGLLLEALTLHGSDTAWMVGDGITDIQAGAALGLRTGFLGPRKCDGRKFFQEGELAPTWWGADLGEFADYLLNEEVAVGPACRAGPNQVPPGRRDVQPQAERCHGVPAVSSFAHTFVEETIGILRRIDVDAVERLAQALASVRETGRLFILGVGGSAGHASHAVNDFRKLCGFESYAPTDNVSELTARINDEGWDTSLAAWLKASRLRRGDALLIFSVGGGSREKNISVNLVRAIELAKQVGAKVFGIVGRDGGFTADAADVAVVIPPLAPERITPHTEGLCAVLWHLLVSHPALKTAASKWEATT